MKRNKQVTKSLCRSFIAKSYSRVKIALDEKRRRKMPVKEIFTEIYSNNLWNDSSKKFHSGAGSTEESVVRPYIKKMSGFLKAYGPGKPRVVDLGCGNFEVGRHLAGYCSKYIGIDIVPKLINELNKTKATKSVQFLCLDVIDNKLPEADIACVRQVLQHLSNEQILKILPKLKRYKTVFITEHYPTDYPGIIPNKNIVPGSAIRAYKNSGVYIDKAPFNIPRNALELILEVPGVGMDKRLDQGVIRTYKLVWPVKK